MTQKLVISAGLLKRFHDTELRSFGMFRHERRVVMGFELQSSEIYKIELQNIAAFRCVDIIHQNVVSRILLSTIMEIDQRNLSDIIGGQIV